MWWLILSCTLLGFFFAGCACCCTCSGCTAGTTPRQYQVVLANFAAGGCGPGDCADLNATYLLDCSSAAACTWELALSGCASRIELTNTAGFGTRHVTVTLSLPSDTATWRKTISGTSIDCQLVGEVLSHLLLSATCNNGPPVTCTVDAV